MEAYREIEASSQAVIPLMREQGDGVIINISSGTTKIVAPGVAPYASTKAAKNVSSSAAGDVFVRILALSLFTTFTAVIPELERLLKW